ncbi:MAG TPA: methyltransferase domain-containing protein [Candidatus Omnitrophota bacterium]|nr:methyltransferase domain-containing protein [Candidatus Omnitrophota bacterium]
MDVLLLFLILLLLVFAVWISSALFGAPFQPSSDKALERIVKLAGIKKGQKMMDLGSGNGKIVIEFAKKGIESHGFEINPLLVLWSRRRIRKLGLQKKAFIHLGDFMKQDFSEFNVITSFQISYIMPDLEKKLQRELKRGARVVSNTWKFPNWKPKRKLGDVRLYVKK